MFIYSLYLLLTYEHNNSNQFKNFHLYINPIYFIYTFITNEIKVKLSEANGVLIGLIDRFRMLDNDLIRLRSKLNTVLEIQENERRNDKSKKPKRIPKEPEK